MPRLLKSNSPLNVYRSYWLAHRQVVLLLLIFLAGCSLPGASVVIPTAPPLPTATITPAYHPFAPMLAKWEAVGPVYVTSAQSVPEQALVDAGELLAVMVQHRPDIGANLRAYGAFTVIIGKNQNLCDVRYFSYYTPSECTSLGERGAGGTLASPVTACNEANLLAEPDDPYLRGRSLLSQNLCVHELAHAIMDIGLTQQDRDRIYARYQAARQEGLWTGDYALTNDLEFWAVMSQFYFWAGPSETYAPEFNHVANGPQALKQYDPATFALVDSIYQGAADLR